MRRSRPPRLVDLAGVSAVQNITRRQKKQSLKERVVQDVQQRSGKANDRHYGSDAAESPSRSHTEAQGDDADVLDLW